MALTKARTKWGAVSGVAVDTAVTVFKGVPYAKPPVGSSRFAQPQPAEAWIDELACERFKPGCIQPPHQFHDGEVNSDQDISEDCLYLNIWTPAIEAGEKLPVMFWIHGGGFTVGRANEPQFDGTALAHQGVILVSVAYRCGVMGFLANKELAERNGLTTYGNYGILDQIAALEWVKDNINAFGGDSDNVTIFGQSAGGMSVRMLLTSPLAKGLINRVIVHSGGGLNEGDPVRPKEELADITSTAMEILGWTVDDLLERDPEEITVKIMEAAKEVTSKNELFIFQPCVDGYSITEVPGVLIKAGSFPEDVSLMCGTVSGDSWMFSRKVRKDLMGNKEALRAFSYSPQISWGRTQIANGRRPLYSYFFEHIRPGEAPKFTPDGASQLVAPHGAEIAYAFGNLAVLADNFDWQDYDYALSSVMLAYWANYAKTGNPNGDGLPQWTQFTENSPLSMNFRDDGFDMRDLIDNEIEEQVIRFTIDNPGMLETLENFEKAIV